MWSAGTIKLSQIRNPLYCPGSKSAGTVKSGERGKATSPAQLPNLILPICGIARPHRASEPPRPKQSSGNDLPFIIVNFYLKRD